LTASTFSSDIAHAVSRGHARTAAFSLKRPQLSRG
jgi:hypothetical protein